MGSSVGKIEGAVLEAILGTIEGTVVGTRLGPSEISVGKNVGSLLGTWDGNSVGTPVAGSSIDGAAVPTKDTVGPTVVSSCDVGGGELLFTLDSNGVGDGVSTKEAVGDGVSG